jgi:regulation of enolase protein 1 (concanavalin A-like superfamily)
VLQYDYSHDNAGAGYMLAHRDNDLVHTGNVVRWNVSQNDARRFDYAAIHLWGRIRNAQIYHNTVYLAGGNAQSRVLHARNNTIEAQDLENVRVSNNLFISTGGQPLVDFSLTALDGSSGVRLEGNAYWSSGGAFRLLWKGVTYTSLAQFRAATGQERLNDTDVGRSVEPDLAAAGAGPTFNDPAMLKGLWQYRLKVASQLVDAGIDLAELGINIGARDFFGGTSRKLASDIGAHELDAECSWSLTPSHSSAGITGASGSIGVWAAADSCGWAVQPQAAWITASPPSGSGQGNVAYTVAANGGAARTGTITIGNQTFVITQEGSGTPPPPPPPSAGTIGEWTFSDVGATGIAGGSSLSGSTYSLRGGGADIWGTADAFHFLRQPVSGDWEIEARVATVENIHAWTKAGVMIRDTADAGSKHAAIYVTPGKGISFQYRTSTGGTSGAGTGLSGTAPQTVRLSRQGSTLTAFLRRADGSWATVGSATIAMGASVQIGLVIGSHDATRAATATFDGVTVRPVSTAPPPPPPPPPPPLASPWNHNDIGAVAFAGSASGDTTIAVEGAGADIWNSADAFHFVHRQVSGDWDVDATVTSVEAVHAWTKAGVMIRETLSAGSAHAAIYVTPGKGISFQYRATTGGPSGAGVGVTGSAPKRLRISRRGSTLTGYLQNADGSWRQVGSASIVMGTSVYVGLAVGSHDNSQLATASFTDVVLTQP